MQPPQATDTPTDEAAAAELEATQRRVLDKSLVHGIAWTGGMKWATQILSWFSTLVVARLLTPGDYGLANMAAVYIGLVQLVNEFGLSAAVVQRRDLSEDQIAKIGGLSVLLGAFFWLLSMALAIPVARFFGEPALRAVILVLSITFFASAFQVLPRSLLTRDLQFQKLAWLDGIEAISGTVITLVLALLGFRYWSLVLGGVGGRVIVTVFAMAWHRHRLAWPAPFAAIKAPVSFGAHMVVANIAWYAFRSADVTVIGRTLGKTALGAYSIGWNLASIPVDRISALVARSTAAIFASVQTDAAALRRYVLALTEGIALLTFPAAVGLSLLADEFVLLVLGPGWQSAVLPLRLLSLAAVFRSLIPLLNQVLVATGQSKRNMQATIALAVTLPALFWVGSRWGLGGVALVWIVAYPIVAGPFLVRPAFAVCDLKLSSYLRALWPAFSASLVMAIVVLIARVLLPPSWPLAVRFLSVAALGASTYAAAVYSVHGARLRTFLALLRSVRN